MNIIRRFLFIVLCLILPDLCQAQDTLSVNTDSLCIDIRYMMPQRYNTKVVTDFSLCFKGDTVMSYLPYMGRVYQPVWGDTGGMNFSLPITDKSVKKGKKGKVTIKFSCRDNTTGYDFSIDVYPEGSAEVYVIPSNADPIGYRGDWNQ